MPNMKVMILGGRGQLGTDLVQALAGWDVAPFTHADVDICNLAQTARVVAETKPDVVINSTAFHKVEECEEKPEQSFQVNALAVHHLARVCDRHQAVLVHVSTDYVFGGGVGKPYVETDCANPVNVYGASKLAGEALVRQ